MTYRQSFQLPVAPKDAYQALTDPQQLACWFAEHVDIELRPGGAYRFWGQNTLWVPRRADADQRITRLEPERALGFDWTWKGCPCHVELQLSPVPGGAQLAIDQSFGAQPPEAGDETSTGGPLRNHQQRAKSDDPARDYDLVVDAFWDLAMANLRHYLAERAPFLLPLLDGTRAVQLSVWLDATPERVFRALTSAQGLIDWMGADEPSVELVAGGAYSYGWRVAFEDEQVAAGPRRVVDIVADRLLVHDWSWPGEPHTQVRWELEAVDGGTRLQLSHTGFAGEPQSQKIGWASALAVLAQQLAGAVVPSWLSPAR